MPLNLLPEIQSSQTLCSSDSFNLFYRTIDNKFILIFINRMELTTHNNVKCDGCKMYPIIGTRYKCLTKKVIYF